MGQLEAGRVCRAMGEMMLVEHCGLHSFMLLSVMHFSLFRQNQLNQPLSASTASIGLFSYISPLPMAIYFLSVN